jgi:hypothetical protein
MMAVFAWPFVAMWGIDGAGSLFSLSRLVDVVLLVVTLKRLDIHCSQPALVSAGILLCCAYGCAWNGLLIVGTACLAAFLVAVWRLVVGGLANPSHGIAPVRS